MVPGDARLDLTALKTLAGGTYVAFASTEKAEALAGSVTSTILPLSFHPDLELVVDPGPLRHTDIFFNAARMDRSLALATKDYLRIAGGEDPPHRRMSQPRRGAVLGRWHDDRCGRRTPFVDRFADRRAPSRVATTGG